MKTTELLGYKREELSKSSLKKLRAEAYVPCVLYGGEEPVHFSAPMILFRELVYTPDVYKVKLNIEGTEYDCILQDIQFHPVSDIILHADFLQLFDDKPVKMQIPVKFYGNSPGMQKGGKLISKLKRIKIKALPDNLPDYINVDISKLELGKSVKVKDIQPESYEILVAPSDPIASVEIPRALRGKQTADEEEEEAAPEA